jgi:hypothetical protein
MGDNALRAILQRQIDTLVASLGGQFEGAGNFQRLAVVMATALSFLTGVECL